MEYDYYYSKEHDEWLNFVYSQPGKQLYDCFVNGIKYTEMIESGKEPCTKNFPDIVKVYTGSDEGIEIKKSS